MGRALTDREMAVWRAKEAHRMWLTRGSHDPQLLVLLDYDRPELTTFKYLDLKTRINVYLKPNGTLDHTYRGV